MVAMIAGLWMTQSRGPWIGAMILFAVLWLPLASSFRQALAVVLVLSAVGGTGAYLYGKKYTAGSREQAQTVEQEDAIYRRELIGNYMPLVLEKPLTGWGISFYPSVRGQKSIDNEYLFLAVTQGVPGLLLFVAISVGGCVRVARLLRYAERADDRFLLYAHLAVVVSLLVTMTTVYLGQQVEPLYFLVLGWMQAMDRDRLAADSEWTRKEKLLRQWTASVMG
jgi:O-antigen ligase